MEFQAAQVANLQFKGCEEFTVGIRISRTFLVNVLLFAFNSLYTFKYVFYIFFKVVNKK